MVQSFEQEVVSFETIADFLRYGLSKANQTGLYFGHGTDNAWDDIYALVLGSLSLPLDLDARLLDAKLTTQERNMLCHQLEKRIIQHIPQPYLTKEAYFCGLSYFVDERVLIPRSPIAEYIQNQFEPFISPRQVQHILDIGTGSGAIAIACCHAFPNAAVDAVDISRDALDVAQVNAARHGVEDQLNLLQSDCFDVLPHHAYDVIVSNPPYVSEDEMATLPKEYQHEPELALFANQDGLEIVERILRQSAKYLSEQGILIMEVGNTEHQLTQTYPEVPFTWLDFEHGGHGVFMLTASQIKASFAQ